MQLDGKLDDQAREAEVGDLHFWALVLEKTPENILDSQENKQNNSQNVD